MHKLPFLYSVIFSLLLGLTFGGTMLTIFVIPREVEGDITETIDLSAFTKPEPPTESPTFVLTLPSLGGTPEPPTEGDSDELISTDAPTEPPILYPIITENSSLDEQISIVISTLREFGSDFYIADVRISDPFLLKTAFAQDRYGLNITEKPSEQARRVGAILAINGDYYGANEKGYVIRNGTIYRTSVRTHDEKHRKYFEDLAFLWNGDLVPFDEKTTTIDDLKSMGVFHVFAFGPTLLKNGEIVVDADTEVGVSNPNGNPRTAIAQIAAGHYLFVCADGRTDVSRGPTLLELATVLQRLGAVTAYNLDGGGSATMYFNGRVVNKPCTHWNEIMERGGSDIVYIGYN